MLLLILVLLKQSESVTFENVSVILGKTEDNSILNTITIKSDDKITRYLKHHENVDIISVRNQFIDKLTENSITDLPKIKTIILTSNGIRHVAPGSFKNLPSLHTLNLSRNHIEVIETNVFNGLENLRNLDLARNKINRIEVNCFDRMQFETVNFEHNRLFRWNKRWFLRGEVDFLLFGYNFIDELPENAFQFRVGRIFFNNNKLRRISVGVFRGGGFRRLEGVHFDNNVIDRLDGGVFDGVDFVNVLNLSNNSLTDVDVMLSANMRISVLVLEDNRLKCVSTTILRMLDEMDIDGNPITCSCVKSWLDWRDKYSYPAIFHITNLEQENCL